MGGCRKKVSSSAVNVLYTHFRVNRQPMVCVP